MKNRTDFAKHISRFLTEYLPYERNISPNTIKSYNETFIQFITYMRDIKGIKVEKLTLDHFTKENILGFLSWVIKVRRCSHSTRNYRLAAFNSFSRYLQYEEIGKLEIWQKIMTIPNLKTEKKNVNYMTLDAIKLLLAQPDMSTQKGRRDIALLALMYDTGARVQEIIDLTPQSIRIESKPFTIRIIGKGRKTRIVPLLDEQVKLLKKYMVENHLFEPQMTQHPLFYNKRHEKLTRAGVTYILSQYAGMARKTNPDLILGNVSCHILRHSKAMHLLQAGVILPHIRDFLGHVSIMTTEIYARTNSKQKSEALEKAYIKLTPNKDTENLWEKDKDLLQELMNLR